jgi:hypothetical protein
MLLVSNACVALLSGLKVLLIFVTNWALTVWCIFLILIFIVLSIQELLTLRGAQSLPTDIFSMVQSIFKVIGTRHFKPSKLWSPCLPLPFKFNMITASGHPIVEWNFYSTKAGSVWGSWFTSTYWEWYINRKNGLSLNYTFPLYIRQH